MKLQHLSIILFCLLFGLFAGSQALAQAACGDPAAGSCFEANLTPGCDDQACCEAVCAVDLFCCDVSWDSVCAEAAEDICGEGNGPEIPPYTPVPTLSLVGLGVMVLAMLGLGLLARRRLRG